MGNGLRKPVTDKDDERASDAKHGIRCGLCCMQGWRANMEVSVSVLRLECYIPSHLLCLYVCCVPLLQDDHIIEMPVQGQPDLSFVCVLDGHGGSHIAEEA